MLVRRPLERHMTKSLDAYDEAFKLHRYYQELLREIVEEESNARQNEEILLNCVKSGVYEHFKSTPEKPMRYVVFWVERGVDKGPFAVSYSALYRPLLGQHATRPLLSPEGEADPQKCNGFLDPIDRLGYRGPRFTLVCECSTEELLRVILATTLHA
jgi:hypothetical protein